MVQAPKKILGFTLTTLQVLEHSNLFSQARPFKVISEMEIKVSRLGSAHCPEVEQSDSWSTLFTNPLD